MKRKDFIRHLEAFGRSLLKEGSKHLRWVNLADHRKQATVPRHREINDFLFRLICRQLGVPPP